MNRKLAAVGVLGIVAGLLTLPVDLGFGIGFIALGSAIIAVARGWHKDPAPSPPTKEKP